MMRTLLLGTIVVTLSACSAERRPDIPSQNIFPPVGLAATAVWLEQRRAPVPQRVRAADIPTEDLCDIVDDCLSVVARPVR